MIQSKKEKQSAEGGETKYKNREKRDTEDGGDRQGDSKNNS